MDEEITQKLLNEYQAWADTLPEQIRVLALNYPLYKQYGFIHQLLKVKFIADVVAYSDNNTLIIGLHTDLNPTLLYNITINNIKPEELIKLDQ